MSDLLVVLVAAARARHDSRRRRVADRIADASGLEQVERDFVKEG